jgi:hypothetical protein
LVAEKVAGISPRKQMVAMSATGDGMALWEDEFTRRDDVLDFCKRHPQYRAVERDQWPNYLGDANAVISLLEKHTWECWRHEGGDYSVRLSQTSPITRCAGFTRAACLALLAAHGVDVVKDKT